MTCQKTVQNRRWGNRVSQQGGGHLDVCIKRVGSKDGASPLISLSLILFKGGHVAGVSVSQASNGDGNIAPGWLHLYKASSQVLHSLWSRPTTCNMILKCNS